MSTYRTYTPVLSRTCGSCGQPTGRWQCNTCALVVCTACDHACPQSDGGAAAPPAGRAGAPTPPAAESATTAAPPSSTTGGRVTSEVATLPSVPREGTEVSRNGDQPRLGLVRAFQGGQQVLGTCSPGATGSPGRAS